MHITLEADYAIRIVHCLCETNSRMDASSIAGKTGVTLRFSLKILRKLVGGGIINSYLGKSGGYELAKSADDISLREVIETVEGPLSISRCHTDSYQCENPCGCNVKHIFDKLTNELRVSMESVKFSSLSCEPDALPRLP